MSHQLEEIDEMEVFPGEDPDGMLVDPNMIPTAATEVVMSGDGIQRDFGEDHHEDAYQYEEYTYEEDPDGHHHMDHHPHLTMEEEVVEADDEVYPHEQWKQTEHKTNNMFEEMDGKLFLEEEKTSKRGYHYQSTTPTAGEAYPYTPDDVGEYREFPIYGTPKSQDRMCPGCGMMLRRSVYYHHARMIRDKGACNLFTPQRFPCTQCDARIGTLEKLCQHMEQIHQAPTQIKTALFSSEADFLAFRIELEGKGGNFRMARGNKKSKKGVVQYFRCNRLQTLSRANTYRPVDNPELHKLPSNRKKGRLQAIEGQRTPSAKQVIRTENSCTAFYNKAFLPNGTIEVRYCEHHLHDDEKLRLPDAVRARVIELARKNLPHVVVLMIIKDERFKYCDAESANDRRIQDMKTQDIRQVLAGNNRAEKNRNLRNEEARLAADPDHSGDANVSGDLTMDDDPNRPWADIRPPQKIDRMALSKQELKYLDLFDSNREEIMSRLNEKTRIEQDKKLAFDSFIHRLSASQEVMKQIEYRQLIPNESTILKLKKAFQYLNRIEDLLMNPRRAEENANTRFVSYIRMMEEEAELEMERTKVVGRLTPSSSLRPENPLDEIDVVGIDEDDFRRHHGGVVGEEEVVEYQEDEVDMDDYLRGQMEEEEHLEDDMEQIQVEEVVEEVEGGNEEEMHQMQAMHIPEEHVEEEVEEVEMNGEEEEEEEEESEQTVTRTGRVVKKKAPFDT